MKNHVAIALAVLVFVLPTSQARTDLEFLSRKSGKCSTTCFFGSRKKQQARKACKNNKVALKKCKKKGKVGLRCQCGNGKDKSKEPNAAKRRCSKKCFTGKQKKTKARKRCGKNRPLKACTKKGKPGLQCKCPGMKQSKCSSKCFFGDGKKERARKVCNNKKALKKCRRKGKLGVQCRCDKSKKRDKKEKCSSKCIFGKNKNKKARKLCNNKKPLRKCHGKGGEVGVQCKCPGAPKPSPKKSPQPKKSPKPEKSTPPRKSPNPTGEKTFPGIVVSGQTPNVTVLDCNEKSLFLQVADASTVKTNSIFWAVPKAGDDICSDCNYVIRRIREVSKEKAFGGMACPSGKTCLRAKTVMAKLSEIVTEDGLEKLGIEGDGNEALEPLLNCSFEESSRGIKNMMSVRQISEIPTTCDGWEEKTSDGVCAYSGCFLGEKGNPKQCLHCKSKCNTGCGPKRNDAIPDEISGVFDFRDSCCIHDKCYTSKFSKPECDFAFLRDNLLSCAKQAVESFSLTTFPIELERAKVCATTGFVYFVGVLLGGGSFYKSAQEKRIKYEQESTCSAPCSATRQSGGQGNTTINVNLKKKSGTFNLSYEMFGNPDALELTYEGKTLFTTGGLVSGSDSVSISYSGSSSVVTVKVMAPNSGTKWNFQVDCAF